MIENFPRTIADLDRLRNAPINNLLRRLGVAPVGTLAEKRALVKFHIGVVVTTSAVPVP